MVQVGYWETAASFPYGKYIPVFYEYNCKVDAAFIAVVNAFHNWILETDQVMGKCDTHLVSSTEIGIGHDETHSEQKTRFAVCLSRKELTGDQFLQGDYAKDKSFLVRVGVFIVSWCASELTRRKLYKTCVWLSVISILQVAPESHWAKSNIFRAKFIYRSHRTIRGNSGRFLTCNDYINGILYMCPFEMTVVCYIAVNSLNLEISFTSCWNDHQ